LKETLIFTKEVDIYILGIDEVVNSPTVKKVCLHFFIVDPSINIHRMGHLLGGSALHL